jgi:hypothetical protein
MTKPYLLQVGSNTWLNAFKLSEQLLGKPLLQLATLFAVNIVAIPVRQLVLQSSVTTKVLMNVRENLAVHQESAVCIGTDVRTGGMDDCAASLLGGTRNHGNHDVHDQALYPCVGQSTLSLPYIEMPALLHDASSRKMSDLQAPGVR